MPSKAPPKTITPTRMQVLSLGMCRTGTESMRRALMELSYGRVYHMNATMERPHDHILWGELAERKFGSHKRPITRTDLDEILGDCGGVTDCPCVAFWSELMDAYPDAKIVLVEREIEAWFRSFKAVVLDEVFSWRSNVLIWATNWGVLDAVPFRTNERVMFGVFRARNRADVERNARAVYREHYAAIAAKAEAEGRPLLRVRLDEGWKPLCEFLGKAVPDSEFPRGNAQSDTIAMVRRVQDERLRQLGINVLKRLVVSGVALGLVAVSVKSITGR